MIDAKALECHECHEGIEIGGSGWADLNRRAMPTRVPSPIPSNMTPLSCAMPSVTRAGFVSRLMSRAARPKVRLAHAK